MSTHTCEGYSSPREWVKHNQMPSPSVLPIEQAQPDTAGFAFTGGSHLSHCNIQIIPSADRQSCYVNAAAALLSSGVGLTPRSERPCPPACPRAAVNRANLQCADLSAPKIPSVTPWWGFLRTTSSSQVWLRKAIASARPSGSRERAPSGGEGWQRLSHPNREAFYWGLCCCRFCAETDNAAGFWAETGYTLSHLQNSNHRTSRSGI